MTGNEENISFIKVLRGSQSVFRSSDTLLKMFSEKQNRTKGLLGFIKELTGRAPFKVHRVLRHKSLQTRLVVKDSFLVTEQISGWGILNTPYLQNTEV